MTKVSAIVRTRSLRGGHYRAGLKHEAEPGDIPPGSITEEQLARLMADPDLEVELIETPDKDPVAGEKEGADASQESPPAPKKAPPIEAAGEPSAEEFVFDGEETPHESPPVSGKESPAKAEGEAPAEKTPIPQGKGK